MCAVVDAAYGVMSGGQTGVDRAALDAALHLGVACGGWCPRGRRAEDGPIADRYPLRETPSCRYEQRTEWNVRDADATLIIGPPILKGGTDLTARLASAYRRPLHIHDASEQTIAWLREIRPRLLNVAGPRQSEWSAAYGAAMRLMESTVVPELQRLYRSGRR